MRESTINTLVITVFVVAVAFVGILAWHSPIMLPPVVVNTEAESKPLTKTRCDFTGVLASSIIEEERGNGYKFDGRISTFLCGENGLSFSLIGE